MKPEKKKRKYSFSEVYLKRCISPSLLAPGGRAPLAAAPRHVTASPSPARLLASSRQPLKASAGPSKRIDFRFETN